MPIATHASKRWEAISVRRYSRYRLGLMPHKCLRTYLARNDNDGVYEHISLFTVTAVFIAVVGLCVREFVTWKISCAIIIFARCVSVLWRARCLCTTSVFNILWVWLWLRAAAYFTSIRWCVYISWAGFAAARLSLGIRWFHHFSNVSRCIRLSSLFSHNKLVSSQAQTMQSLVAALDHDYEDFVVFVRLVFFSRKIHFYWDYEYHQHIRDGICVWIRKHKAIRYSTRIDRPNEKKQIRSKQRVLFTWNTNHQWPKRTQNRRREIEKMKNASNSAFGIPWNDNNNKKV